MAATFVLLTICLVYGAVAHPGVIGGSGSYPVSGGGGRPAVVGPIVAAPVQSASVVSGPSASYLPPPRRVGGRRPAGHGHGYGSSRAAVSAQIIQRPVATGHITRPVGQSVGIGASRPISAGIHHGGQYSAHRVGASGGSRYGHRTVGSHAPY